LEVLQGRAWVDAELLGQLSWACQVGRQGLGLATRGLQGEHELAVEALTQRMGRHQCMEFTDQLGVVAAGKLGLDAVPQRPEAALLQPDHLPWPLAAKTMSARARPTPQLHRIAQQACRLDWATGGQHGPTPAGQSLKADKIEFVGPRSIR
jgi:hypothetical protein